MVREGRFHLALTLHEGAIVETTLTVHLVQLHQIANNNVPDSESKKGEFQKH